MMKWFNKLDEEEISENLVVGPVDINTLTNKDKKKALEAVKLVK